MKLEGYSIIGSQRGEGAGGTWQATNPATGEELEVVFHAENEAGLDKAVALAEEAFASYGESSSQVRAEFLRAIADEIDAIEEEIVPRMMAETALPELAVVGKRGVRWVSCACLLPWWKRALGLMRALIWHSQNARQCLSLTFARCSVLWVQWQSFARVTFLWPFRSLVETPRVRWQQAAQ